MPRIRFFVAATLYICLSQSLAALAINQSRAKRVNGENIL